MEPYEFPLLYLIFEEKCVAEGEMVAVENESYEFHDYLDDVD